jgi:hypothetical protein
MHDSVRASFADFSKPMEGVVNCMYQDQLGLVSTGIGNLINSEDAAWDTRNHGAPWLRKSGGAEASEAEVRQEWREVANDPSLLGNPAGAKARAKLILSEQGIANLVASKLDQFEQTLKSTAEFSALEEWPADAQLGLFSMAWAMGPAFAQGGRWPSFRSAANDRDWLRAAANCNMSNDWLIRRNAVQRGLFRNAAWVMDEVGDEKPRDLATLYIAIPGRRPVLRQGMSDDTHAGQGFDDDESVSALQYFLGWLKFYGGKQSGFFDEETDSAVRDFQRFERNLPANQAFVVDGIVGQISWAALGYVVPSNG